MVNSTLDVQDDRPGDGACATATTTCTLRAAITEANALAGADVITLPAGTYTTTLVSANEDGNSGGDFDISSDITINGAGARTTIVQADRNAGVATERVFHLRYVTPGTTAVLGNMTIRHGRYTDAHAGAGVRVQGGAGVATFNGVHIVDNENAFHGGGMAISNASGSITTLIGCRVENNVIAGGSLYGAGIYFSTSSATLNINSSVIISNTVSQANSAIGGGIYSEGSLNITDSVIYNNTTTSSGPTSYGGGIAAIGGTVTILASGISGNSSTGMTVPYTGRGGGIYNQDAILNLTDSVVSGNVVGNMGGGVMTSSINMFGQLTALSNITDSLINDNTSNLTGGGVANDAGFSTSATTNINYSTVSGNSVGTLGRGGGLYNASGGGLEVFNFTNSTLSGNTAMRGAGSYSSGANSTINFTYATVASNAASTSGGGIFQAGSGVTNLRTSIVADNAAPTGPDISGAVASQFFNHVENVGGAAFTPNIGDVVGTDPQLGPLADNGGGWLTHLPAASSPVINAIPNGLSDCGTGVTTSQNGNARPQESGCEKGSVEVNFDLIFRDGFDGAGNIIGARFAE